VIIGIQMGITSGCDNYYYFKERLEGSILL